MVDYLKIKDTFCVLPWINLFIDTNGDLKTCLVSQRPILKNDKSRSFNVSDIDDLDAVMNSDTLKEIRASMLQGKWNKTCHRCMEPEKAGGAMERIWFNNTFRKEIIRLLRNTREDGSIDPKIMFLDLRLGNLCNLSCRMCSPCNSRKLLGEMEILYPEKKDYFGYLFYMEKFKNITWIHDREIWKKIYRLIPDLRYLHMAGGEPMLIKEAAVFLEKCIEMGYSRNIVLRYSTNATIIQDGIEKLWQKFAKVRLICSIDGYDKMNNYIRYPSNWNDIDSNLKRYDKYNADYNLELVQINTCVQAVNIFHLGEFYEYLTSSNFNFIGIAPMLSAVDHPEFLSCKIMPPRLKEEAKKYLLQTREKYKDRIPENCRVNIRYFDYIIENMLLEQRDDLIPAFLNWNEGLDRLRNQNLFEIAPELKMLQEYGR